VRKSNAFEDCSFCWPGTLDLHKGGDGPRPVGDRESLGFWHEHSEEFISDSQKERHLGYGFVPFIGARFSAPSGGPLVDEHWYLAVV
jgi:hypothetical protein